MPLNISLKPPCRITTLLLILYIWFGMIYARVSYHFGGIVLIGTGYLLLICVLYPWKISFAKEDNELGAAILWFLLYACIIVIGTEVFQRYQSAQWFGPIKMGVDTFHIVKSLPIWLSFFLIQSLDKKSNALVNLIVGLLLIDMLFTMYALEVIPNFTKNLSAGIVSDDMLPYKINGAMGYELTYSIVLIAPLLFVNAYHKKNVLLWCAAIVSVIYVYQCSFMIALLMLVMNVGLSLVLSIRNTGFRLSVFYIVIFLSAALLIEQQSMGTLFLSLADTVENVELQLRFQQISDMFLYHDTSGASLNRLSLYGNDLMGIIKSPVVGSYLADPDFCTSGHSTILGIWGSLGLLGIVPFFQVIRHTYRYATQEVASYSLRGVVLAAYGTFIALAILNPVFADPHIFVCVIWVIPVLAKNLK